jgi:hypothetical protein
MNDPLVEAAAQGDGNEAGVASDCEGQPRLRVCENLTDAVFVVVHGDKVAAADFDLLA